MSASSRYEASLSKSNIFQGSTATIPHRQKELAQTLRLPLSVRGRGAIIAGTVIFANLFPTVQEGLTDRTHDVIETFKIKLTTPLTLDTGQTTEYICQYDKITVMARPVNAYTRLDATPRSDSP